MKADALHCYRGPQGDLLASHLDLPYDPVPMEALRAAQEATCVFDQPKETSCAAFAPAHPAQLALPESPAWLDTNALDQCPAAPEDIVRLISQGRLRAVNANWPGYEALLAPHMPAGKRVHIIGLGDVGSTAAIGLMLLGAGVVERVGLCDRNPTLQARWEQECNQIDNGGSPRANVVSEEEIFDCDVLVFCASAGVPPIGTAGDVRMAQLAPNSAILEAYAARARAARFEGIFAVASDPVDRLCRVAFLASNRNESGAFDGRGLRPEQVRGYGLGVMAARARYHARLLPGFTGPLEDIRVYGPHGEGLVAANSLSDYDETLSLALTRRVVEANLDIRNLGYKPYVGPALSSIAIPLLRTLRGQWHESATCLGGIWFGARNRLTPYGIQLLQEPLPPGLYQRIQASYEGLNP